MRLRVRSLESKQTLKLNVPDSCSLLQFKQTLSQSISSSPSPSSLHLSLNRTDEIIASNPHDENDVSLLSLGITNGDLIFYTLNPNAFNPKNPIQHSPQEPMKERQDFEMKDGDNDDVGGIEQCGVSESLEIFDGSDEMTVKTDSEPSFVKRVVRETLGGDDFDVNDVKLLIVAVHAVILESGFVLLDKVSGLAVGCSNIRDYWPSVVSTLSVRYSLHEILSKGSDFIDSVVLKFQNLGHFVNVYGSLSVGGSGLHRVTIDKRKFAPALGLMLAKSDSNDSSKNLGAYDNENEVFQLWKMVKDGLALPLLIDLCDKAGLGSPPCFMRLPIELKFKVLECLHGVDVAKMACTCSEMRYLSSNNDLWKQKLEELIGQKRVETGSSSYKSLFATEWFALKLSKRYQERAIVVRNDNPRYYGVRRDPNPFGIPSIIGGDYDRLPGFGVPAPFGQPGLPHPAFQPRRRFHPMCNFHDWNV